MRCAAFLERDGVINLDRAYVHCWEDFESVTGGLDVAARLSAASWKLVVVTNQSGIARGCDPEEDYQALTGRILDAFGGHGAPIAAVCNCPHHPSGRVAALSVDCDCRKPAHGIGRAYLVRSDTEESPSGGDAQESCDAEASFKSLADCVHHALERLG